MQVLLLLTSSLFAVAPPPPAADRTIAAPCESVWPLIEPAVVWKGFKLAKGDKARGVMNLKWKKGVENWLTSTKEVAAWTDFHPASDEVLKWFAVDGAVLTLSPDHESCRASMRIEFRVFREDINRQSGWIPIPSKGKLEGEVLDRLKDTVEK